MRLTAMTAGEVQEYKTEVATMNGFTSLMREHFELTYDTYQGYTQEEFDQVINETVDPDKKLFLSELRPRGDGREKLHQGETNSSMSRRYERMVGCVVRRPDGKYNIIVVKASQIKEIESKKLLACGVGVVALGILAGVALGSVGFDLLAAKGAAVAGIAVIGGGAVAIGSKTDSERNNMPDVVCGFIVYELERRDVLVISNNQIIVNV